MKSLVEAYKWFNVVIALGGEEGAVEARDKIAREMTAEEIAEAQRLSEEWLESFRRRKSDDDEK